MQEEFNKELTKIRGKTKCNIWKYIKDDSVSPVDEEEGRKGKKRLEAENFD